MRMGEAADDFALLAGLPGLHKIILRGNHDYWWTTKRKLTQETGGAFVFLQNEAVACPPFVIAGTRGWEFPSPEATPEENADRTRIVDREVGRLRLSLERAHALGPARRIVAMHFPPLYANQERTAFTDILDEAAPEVVVYGHLHGAPSHASAFQGVRSSTRYVLVSADAVDFTPVLIAEA
jgi:hypothetical protein